MSAYGSEQPPAGGWRRYMEYPADDWLTPFDGSGRDWHENLPSPYTYQPSDFSKLVAAVHEYECALRQALGGDAS